MQRERVRKALVVALALGAFAGTSRVAGAADSPQANWPVEFRAVGVRNDANVATVISCTNISGNVEDIEVEFFNAGGSSVCNIWAADTMLGQTATFATQPITSLPGSIPCPGAGGPTIDTGYATLGGAGKIRCSAMLITPATTPPGFAVSLEIYPVN